MLNMKKLGAAVGALWVVGLLASGAAAGEFFTAGTACQEYNDTSPDHAYSNTGKVNNPNTSAIGVSCAVSVGSGQTLKSATVLQFDNHSSQGNECKIWNVTAVSATGVSGWFGDLVSSAGTGNTPLDLPIADAPANVVSVQCTIPPETTTGVSGLGGIIAKT